MEERKSDEEAFHSNGQAKIFQNGVDVSLLNGKTKVKKVPEGGWGFVVWFMYGMCMLLQCGEMTTVSIIFNDYLIEICGSKGAAFNLLMTTSSYGLIFGGIGVFMLNIILKKFTPRQVCLFGACLQLSGDLTLLLMKTPVWFFIAGAGFKGISIGILLATSNIVFSGYFVRYRTTMMSLAVVFSCVGGIIFPPVAVYLMHTVGLKGCIGILLAMNLNIFAVALSMVEFKPRIKTKKRKSEHRTMKDLIKKDKTENHNIEYVDWNRRLRSTLSKLASNAINVMELKLLKDPIFVNIVLGVATSIVTESLFIPVLPMILKSMLANDETIAFFMSVGSALELIAKLSTALVSYFFKINNRLMFYISIILMAAFRVVLVYSSTYEFALASTIAIALSRTLLQISSFLVIVDYVGAENLAAANSISQIITMSMLAIGNSVVGAVRSNTDGHVYSIHTINIFTALCIVIWTIEFITKKRICTHKEIEER